MERMSTCLDALKVSCLSSMSFTFTLFNFMLRKISSDGVLHCYQYVTVAFEFMLVA